MNSKQLYKLKKTELGEIPEQWTICNLGECVELRSGKSNPTKNLSDNNPIPVYGANGITGYFTEYIMETPTIVIGRVGEYAGSIHITKGKSWITDNAIYFSKLPDFIDVNFLGSFLILYDLGRLAEKTGQPKLTQVPIKQIKMPIPSLKEQQKIASFLSKVDELIQKTDQIIEQTQRLKKGLMQRLLTKGIGHSKFKETEIGEIPEDWNLVEVGEITTKITDMDHKMPKKTESGVPFITVRYLTKFDSYYLDLIRDPDLEYISEEDFKHHSKKFNTEYGDLLISRYGTIGVTKVLNTQQKLLASYSIALMKPNRDLVFPLFLTLTLNSGKIKKQIQSFVEQSSNTNLDLLRIKKIKIPKPNIEEQQKIASIISSIDQLIKEKNKVKFQLENIKKGLMQNLLTGKIRVKV